MAVDLRRLYYNAVLGALGGLISWPIIGLLLNLETSELGTLFLKDALLGATVGICIGGAIGAADGLLVSRSIRRLVRGVSIGGLIGMVGGLIGLVLGEVVFSTYAQAGEGWPRAIGWGTFGLFVGMGEGWAQRSRVKITFGAIGGFLGGMIGGSTYERLLDFTDVIGQGGSGFLSGLMPDNPELPVAVGTALGLLMLGASIGVLIGLVEDILRRAWLKVVVGRQEGHTFTLSKRTTVLGKADNCDVVLIGDDDISPRHAAIEQTKEGFSVAPLAQPTAHNRQPLDIPCPLAQGDRIQLGRTQMIFNLEGKKK